MPWAGPAAGGRAGDQVGELVLAVALPVTAMDEHDAGRVGVGLREQVPGVALALAVAKVEMVRVGGAEGAGGEFPRGVQNRTVTHVVGVVIGGVAFGLAEEGPPGVDRGHGAAFLYQSMICRPCQNSV